MKSVSRWFIIAALATIVTTSAIAAEDVISAKGSNCAETGLGNLVADAVRKAVSTDFAFVPASYLREADIPIGRLNANTVLGVLLNPNQQISILTLKGSQIRQALERSVSLDPKTNSGFLQVSGISYRYDPSLPSGKRVGDILIGHKNLDEAQSFRVAMPGSLASGGLGYFRIWGDARAENTKISVGDAIHQLFSNPVDASIYAPSGKNKRS